MVMSTRHVLLGLLEIRPMTGYDLMQVLTISLESLWAASYGQIYPMLHKLADEGLVRAEHESTGRRERIVYHLTPAGRSAFVAWLASPVSYLPFRDPFKLWASYLDAVPPAAAEAGLERHIALQQERLEQFEEMAQSIERGDHPLIQARAETLEPEALRRLKASRAMIFRELAEQARCELESARRIRSFWERELGGRDPRPAKRRHGSS